MRTTLSLSLALVALSLLPGTVAAQDPAGAKTPPPALPVSTQAKATNEKTTVKTPVKTPDKGTAPATVAARPSGDATGVVHAPTKLSQEQKEAMARAAAEKARAAIERKKAELARDRAKYLADIKRMRDRARRRFAQRPRPWRPRRKNQGLLFHANGYTLKLSGFLQLHSVYASESTTMIESPLKVSQTSLGSTNAISPRFSRLRADVSAPNVFCLSPSGVFEIDFYGNMPSSSTSVRQAQPRMRLAYGQITRQNLTIRFGNDWMVAAPQFASGLDPFNLWGQGNLWMRYPQLKAKYDVHFNPGMNLAVEASVGDNMGGDSPKNEIVRNGGMGEYSSIPVVQGRLGFNFKLSERSAFSTIGVSGSWQRLDLSVRSDLTDQEKENVGRYLYSWFWAVDGQFNYTFHKVKIKGTFEYHQGQGIGMYWGGILQTMDFRATEINNEAVIQEVLPVKSIGYFADLNVRFPCGLGFYGGHGKNAVDEDDLFSAGSVIRNQTFYAGLTWTHRSLLFGLGGAYMLTDYIADPDTKSAFAVEALARFTF